MTTYLEVTDAQVQPEAPITSALMTQLRDNPLAIAEGDPTAPNGGMNFIEGGTAAGSTESFSIVGLEHFLVVKIFMHGLRGTVDGDDFIIISSSNGGSSYDQSAGDYRWSFTEVDSATSATDTVFSSSSTVINLAENIGTASDEGLNLEVTIASHWSVSRNTQFWWQGSYQDTGGVSFAIQGSGVRLDNQADNAFLFAPTPGDFEIGEWAAYGIRLAAPS